MTLPIDSTKHVRVPMTDEEFRAQIVANGFTHGQLHDTFMWLQEGKNWKLKIDKVLGPDVTDDEIALIRESINYNAGGGATFSRVGGVHRVKAPGYYNIIGA